MYIDVFIYVLLSLYSKRSKIHGKTNRRNTYFKGKRCSKFFLKTMKESPSKKDKEFRKKLDKLASKRRIPF